MSPQNRVTWCRAVTGSDRRGWRNRIERAQILRISGAWRCHPGEGIAHSWDEIGPERESDEYGRSGFFNPYSGRGTYQCMLDIL